MIEPGLYGKMSNDDYHAGEGVSKSFLHTLLTWSPLHAITPKKETPALFDGQAIHCATFEPLRYSQEYEEKPEGMNFMTKKGKAWRAAAHEAGKKIVEYQKNQNHLAMAKSVRERLEQDENPIIQSLLSDGEAEVSGFWRDPDNPELLCKIRMDWLNQITRIITDLKSTEDARPHAFQRDAYKNGYDMQAGWYLYGLTRITGVEHKDFYFIVCEKNPPYGVEVYKASQEFIDHGLTRCARALKTYWECKEKNTWPCYEPKVKEVELPGWVKRQEGYNGAFG